MDNLYGDSVKLILVLAGILALAYASLRFWLPRAPGFRALACGPIQVLARFPLEARKNLYIVKAGSAYLLLGTAEGSIHLISSLEGAPLEALASAAPAAAPDFRALLKRWKP